MRNFWLLLIVCTAISFRVDAGRFDHVRPTRNVIVMIPDGTSLSSVSAARWYQWYNNPDKEHLSIDPYLCGTVRTTSSNAPIGDSAPTTSTYMTGYLSQTGFVATYPPADGSNDIVPVDTSRAYQPLTTVMEASRWLHNKALGLVFTCEFPHATPSDCAAHSYNRNKYEWIAPQTVHQNIQVVIGGGTQFLSPECEAYLQKNGYGVYRDDLKGMRAHQGEKLWALFGEKDMAYDLDRDPDKQPALEETTRLAIDKLSKNENGFVLMVEGSKVDWAAHANDAVGIITEFLAFDRACKVALDFARRDGNTTVVILPDHGNSGLSIGSSRCKGYDRLSKDQLFGQVSSYKHTAEYIAQLLNSEQRDLKATIRELLSIDLTDDEVSAFYNNPDYKFSPIAPDKRAKSDAHASLYGSSLAGTVSNLMTLHSCFGFTTSGHTGEEVFLAVYHPQGDVPTGLITNIEINEYLCRAANITCPLDELTAAKYAPHTEVLKGYDYQIVPAVKENELPTLVVKQKKNTMTIRPFVNYVMIGTKKPIEKEIGSVVVYVDKNNTFYLPANITEKLSK